MKLYFRSPAYWFTHIFFSIGVLYISVLLHELTHHFLCNRADFVAGFYQIDGRTGVGATFCQGPFYSETLAYLVTFAFAIPLGYLKIRMDDKYSFYERKDKVNNDPISKNNNRN